MRARTLPRWGRRLVLALVLLSACRGGSAAAPPPPSRTGPAPAPVERLYDGRLGGGWEDFGWAPRTLGEGPARLELAQQAGWIVGRHGGAPGGPFGGLVFRVRTAAPLDGLLELRLDSQASDVFPRVVVGPQHVLALADGWREAWLPFAALNPRGRPFDRVVLRAVRDLPSLPVELDGLGLTRESPETGTAPPAPVAASATPAALALTCAAPRHRIKPAVYGIAYDFRLDGRDRHQWQLGAASRRWGGNASSRYNWELGNAWNTASDWYFRNVDYTERPGCTWNTFLEDQLAHGLTTALTVPMLGWVPRDTDSASFPVAEAGPQQATDPTRPRYGNGVGPDGKQLPSPPPTRTSVPASPEWVGRWVKAIREKDRARGAGRSVQLYVLDNEPTLWDSTHRDVHPEPVGYDELLERTLAYGSAVRRADPEATIAGVVAWGWPALFYSGKDAAAGFWLAPDRRLHGNEPLVPWLLRKVRAHEQKTGQRLLDVLDVHFYPQGEGMGVGAEGATDPGTSARRIRSTRALWDPTYVDESWIQEPVRLFPRLREWVDRNAPGVRLAVGEYNFGAEGHMSGGLALAEALGRFGEADLEAAYYWTYPAEGSPAYWAFRAFRDFDGAGARFEDGALPTRTTEGVSVFASRDAAGQRYTAVLLNLDPARARAATVALEGCGPTLRPRRRFVYAGDARGLELASLPAARPGAVELVLPPYSITVLELGAEPAQARPTTP